MNNTVKSNTDFDLVLTKMLINIILNEYGINNVTDVSDKHDYIKDLISTTKSTLQTEIADSCATVKVFLNFQRSAFLPRQKAKCVS